MRACLGLCVFQVPDACAPVNFVNSDDMNRNVSLPWCRLGSEILPSSLKWFLCVIGRGSIDPFHDAKWQIGKRNITIKAY